MNFAQPLPKLLFNLSQECVDHESLIPYPVLTERKDQYVAAFKFTALVRPTSTERITFHPLPYVHSIYK